MGKTKVKRQLDRLRRKYYITVKLIWERADRIDFSYYKSKWRVILYTAMNILMLPG